ncbi:MAG: hypothetical protein G01um10148_776 [Parcubacteria group bacterium Gr01-1014_8]|nr:MAG: hypothetical protein G01um10148_776 [Parcubacteria group bacterium Gr01-1014_8]
MRPAFVVEFATPKKYQLRGLWFGPRKPKCAIVWIHGLGGSAFSMGSVVEKLVNKDTAVLTFNNRGFERVAEIKRKIGKKTTWTRAGAAHEVFTDCLDDVQGAVNVARKSGAKNIYVGGQSTGCQKSIYWASTAKGGQRIKGIILLAPVSDYAGAAKRHGKKKIERGIAYARRLIKQGRNHDLLPPSVWSEELDDAQRFLSLYTPDSVEEIFSYALPMKAPKVLKSVKVPILTLWAGKDEYTDRPAKKIEEWFKKHVNGNILTFATIQGATHGFRNKEKIVARMVQRWMAHKSGANY